MRLVIGLLIGVLVMTGAALADDDDYYDWGTPYYDQIIPVSFSAAEVAYAEGYEVVASPRSRMMATADAAPSCGECRSVDPCDSSASGYSQNYSYSSVTSNNDGFGSPLLDWIYE